MECDGRFFYKWDSEVAGIDRVAAKFHLCHRAVLANIKHLYTANFAIGLASRCNRSALSRIKFILIQIAQFANNRILLPSLVSVSGEINNLAVREFGSTRRLQSAI